ncbi:DUF1465 family protein [Sphingomonas prati]|uniref:Regulator of CtrA degradation n=1 Tax=Sphingomonas prati TaxID=1843237 RepID=A0A7W9BSY0_9SPHN|nr:DUF1465 family protein [Sphingomonas prati]MBB5729547.1 regulator of CtrA degradation [Sphingomonas prati]
MLDDDGRYGLTGRLIDTLHTEALLLADEARGYFDGPGRLERDRLSPSERVGFSCESLKVTTRLMHVVAWLMTRRVEGAREGRSLPHRPLGEAVVSDAETIATLPVTAQQLVGASRDLHDRVRRLEAGMVLGETDTGVSDGPVRTLMRRLEGTW